tara:strand:+ start:17425 stop:20949 length:3525 start_codon:yes stop_codon:yes gene_type:complete
MVLRYFTNINQIPKDKHPPNNFVDVGNDDPRSIARNVGTVVMKCFINAYSPFLRREKVENTLSFNDVTLQHILQYVSDETRKSVTTTPSTEGMHFSPRYVYRANYIFGLRETINQSDLADKNILSNDVSFNDLYKEIEEGKNSIADNTRYKKEQSWVVQPSVFDNTLINNIIDQASIPPPEGQEGPAAPPPDDAIAPCKNIAIWSYIQEKVTSDIKGIDVLLDYKKSFVYNGTRQNKENINKIDPNLIQMPNQKSAQTCAADSVHWRLMKRTPLYRGEDFFIEFKKKAKSPNITKRSANGIPFGLDMYRALDVMSIITTNYLASGKIVPINLAVASPKSSEKGLDDKESQIATFDFSNQAYYIIELGHKQFNNNYFIIICERAWPVFVSISGGSLTGNIIDGEVVGRGVSKILGIFDGSDGATAVSGKQLIDAESFRITVRNHLSSLVIQFDGDGIDADPWIVTKSDFFVEEVEVPDDQPGDDDDDDTTTTGQNVTFQWTSTPQRLEVPRGHMTLWSGNILSSFSFGPLQYQQPRLHFLYPPMPIRTNKEEDLLPEDGFNFNNIVIDDTPVGPSKFEIPQDVSLPLDEYHEIALTSTDQDIQGINNTINYTTNQLFSGTRIFTQDAQFIAEYPYTPKDGVQGAFYGSFMRGLSLKEVTIDDGNGQAQHSYLATTKFKRAPDLSRRMEIFVVAVAMGAGDHVFKNDGSFIDESSNKINVTFNIRPSNPVPHLVPEDDWFLLACKTPILTNIRLKSRENQDPRWQTTFLDASDHVHDYSESWSASDFFSMEHTGTIKFLLNRDMIVENDISGDILSLQNKTFYVDIWAGYECGQPGGSYSRMPGYYKLFTGLCHGGTVEEVYGNMVMTCKIEDYTKVLKDTLFFNSPFFDGVKDINAMNELLTMAGFRAEGISSNSAGNFASNFPPNLLIRYMANNSLFIEQFYLQNVDGRLFLMQPYALPSSYSRLQQPAYKFEDGSTFYDAITKLTKVAGKLFYFDQHGIAHYEDFFEVIRQNLLGLNDLPTVFDFTTNPDFHTGQMILNKVDRTLAVSEVNNSVKILSNTPNMTPLWVDELNWAAFDDPESEGFMGYLKTFFQKEGVFGSEEAARKIADFYRRAMFRPPVQINFETYGLPLRSLDIVGVDGQSLRVTRVEHTINPEKNIWWMSVEGERFQPVQ